MLKPWSFFVVSRGNHFEIKCLQHLFVFRAGDDNNRTTIVKVKISNSPIDHRLATSVKTWTNNIYYAFQVPSRKFNRYIYTLNRKTRAPLQTDFHFTLCINIWNIWFLCASFFFGLPYRNMVNNLLFALFQQTVMANMQNVNVVFIPTPSYTVEILCRRYGW